MTNWRSLFLFLIVVLGIGFVIGSLTAPGEWYAGLNKPFFNPPNWVFGPVWTILYVIIAYVGWWIWTKSDDPRLWRLWLAQMALNFLWSPLFFGAKMPLVALIVIVGLLVTLVILIRNAWSSTRHLGILFVPYAAWVSFATALNAAIVVLN